MAESGAVSSTVTVIFLRGLEYQILPSGWHGCHELCAVTGSDELP